VHHQGLSFFPHLRAARSLCALAHPQHMPAHNGRAAFFSLPSSTRVSPPPKCLHVRLFSAGAKTFFHPDAARPFSPLDSTPQQVLPPESPSPISAWRPAIPQRGRDLKETESFPAVADNVEGALESSRSVPQPFLFILTVSAFQRLRRQFRAFPPSPDIMDSLADSSFCSGATVILS